MMNVEANAREQINSTEHTGLYAHMHITVRMHAIVTGFPVLQ